MSKRNVEEFKDLNENPISNCGLTVGLVKEDFYDDWKVTLIPPKDTPYKNGLFFLNIHFPEDYPKNQPEVYFITPIYHVNVNPCAPKAEQDESLGHVCISTLNWWKPEKRMRQVLLDIYSLFYMANPNSAYGLSRAKEYIKEKDTYEEKIRNFTKKYASAKKFYNNQNKFDRDKDWDFNL